VLSFVLASTSMLFWVIWYLIYKATKCPYKIFCLTKHQYPINDKYYCTKWIPEAQLGECGKNARRNSRVMSARLEKKMPPICRMYRTVAPSLLTRFNCVFRMQLQSFKNKSHACEVTENKTITQLRNSSVNMWFQLLTNSEPLLTSHDNSYHHLSTTEYFKDTYVLEILVSK